MTYETTRAYETTRQRHVAYMFEQAPHFFERLSWGRAEIEAEQTRGLRALVRHAIERSPWHRARLAGVDPDGLTPDDLAAIPPMTKADLMANWDAIVTDPRCTLAAAEAHLAGLTTDAYFQDDLHVIASGGSSGTRGVFAYDWHGWAVCWLGLGRGIANVHGYLGLTPEHGPIASVSAHVATHATSALAQTFANPTMAIVRAPVTLPLDEIVRILNATRPAALHAYASMLPMLCDEARAGRLRIAPKAVWSTSEPLFPEVRALVETTWGALVLDSWAASESNGGAFSCPVAPGFHVGEDLNVMELVDDDGRPVPAGGRASRMLLTNLYNRLMPLIRYEITDELQLAAGPCPCGSAYRKIDGVAGRTDDVFAYPDGTRVHPLNFRTVLGKDPAIVEYQVRQTARGADVDVVARATIDTTALAAALARRLREIGMLTPAVAVRRVERIGRQATGKLKRFVPLAAGGDPALGAPLGEPSMPSDHAT